MKSKAIFGLSVITALVIALYFSFHNIIGIDPPIEDTISHVQDLPMNLSIYLDLSDRIKPDGSSALSQKEKDIAIVENLANVIKERAVKQKILPCKDRIKVFFYPAPSDAKIVMLADNLELDLSTTQMNEKKKVLISFVNEFKSSLEKVYTATIETSNWQGSDIWGFFNKPIDTYCIKNGYRNVLVVLTDGYIYYEPTATMQEGHAFSKITNTTLKDPASSLIANREGLENLEVLMLELNPNPMSLQPKMEQVITDWLKKMGVQKCYVGETDVPSNTKMIIENFLN